MEYGYFDNKNREYVINRVDAPVPWINYIGINGICTAISHNAGGCIFRKTPRDYNHDSAPVDRPGYYIYLRDDETGEYWSVSWQPVGKDLEQAKYECRHGLSYSRFSCNYRNIVAVQTVFIPLDDDIMLWDLDIRSTDSTVRKISIYSYVEFSCPHIELDTSVPEDALRRTSSGYQSGVIECGPFCGGIHRYNTASFDSDGFDCLRDTFLGSYRTESNPFAVERGECFNSEGTAENHCGVLVKRLSLSPCSENRLIFILGEGDRAQGLRIRKKYADPQKFDAEILRVRDFWSDKLSRLQVKTPHKGMDTSLNIWNIYQAESRTNLLDAFSSQQAGEISQYVMSLPHAAPDKCKVRIKQLILAENSRPCRINTADISNAYSSNALWIVPAVVEYVKETGDFGFMDDAFPYADGEDAAVYDHLTRILDFFVSQTNNTGKGDAASLFMLYWVIEGFLELLRVIDINEHNTKKYEGIAAKIKSACEDNLWDGRKYVCKANNKIDANSDIDEQICAESNILAIVSGAATGQHAKMAMDSVEEYLKHSVSLDLATTMDSKHADENRTLPSPWACIAGAKLGRGARALEFYDALLPYNGRMKTAPYLYPDFTLGKEHTSFSTAETAYISYLAATRFILGIRPDFMGLVIDPCIPSCWSGFKATRVWRDAEYRITVDNPDFVEKGVKKIVVNGNEINGTIPAKAVGSINNILVIMG